MVGMVSRTPRMMPRIVTPVQVKYEYAKPAGSETSTPPTKKHIT